MKLWLLALTLIAAASPLAAATLPEIEFEKYKLGNGLEVILHEDHSTPIVTVNVWYHVGSKNERPGRTGFAHLFEHMMFQGSKHWNEDFFKPLQEAGGSVNGSTNTDRTNYYEVIPANFLELALWLEADRMGFLLDAMTQERLDNQRDVVKNERRQNYENVPYGTSREVLMAAAYPAGHPYSWLTIGSQEDLTNASLDDVKDFFRRFYTPNNATLTVGGDFDPAAARQLVEKYFGALPPGPPVWQHDLWIPKLEGEKRVTVQDRVQLPRVTLFWHTVPAFAEDDAALDVLAAVLTQGKSSRLYQSLVHRKQIAQDVVSFQDSREISGGFHLFATARPGHGAEQLERELLAGVEAIQKDGPDAAEVERVKNTIEADFIRSVQQVGGFSSRTDRLQFYNHYLGKPGSFQLDLDRYTRVTPKDVQRVARTYLGASRVVMTVNPLDRLAPSTSETAKGVDRTKMPGPAALPSLQLPALERATLSNGLKLLVARHPELPVVEMNLVVAAGSSADPADRPGLANLTAQMLDEGTASRSSVAIASELDSIGSTLSLYTDADSSGAAVSTLRKHVGPALGILADVVLHPAFPGDELERVRKQLQTRLLQEKDNANAIASKAVAQVLFGAGHPYGHPDIGNEKSLAAMSAEELRRFWQERWRPGAATLIVVGDTTLAEVRELAERELSAWPRGDAMPAAPPPPAAQPQERRVYLIDRPGAAQSVISVAHIGLPRSTPDFFPAAVMNAALGGMFMSRLNLNLREKKGYSYGARSSFEFRRSPGPFTAGAGVQTKVTRESLVETLREMDELKGPRPLDGAELEFARNYLVRNFPQRFETPGQIADQLRALVVHGLPDDYFDTYIARVQAVTLEEANRVARERLVPERAAVIVVGDLATIRKGVEELNLGRVVTLDAAGQPIE